MMSSLVCGTKDAAGLLQFFSHVEGQDFSEVNKRSIMLITIAVFQRFGSRFSQPVLNGLPA